MTKIKNLTTIAAFLIGLLSVKAQEPELVKNINTLATSYLPSYGQEMTVANGKVFFKFIQDGYDLGVYDGTTLETFNLNPNSVANPADFTAVGDRVYFTATTNDTGTELWMYENGEVTEIDINVGSGSSNPSFLTSLNGTVYFQADDGSKGKELWKHDGTNATLLDIVEGATGSEPVWLTTYNNELIFYADDGVIGFELYKYDGSEITLIEDLVEGSTGSGSPVTSRNPYFEEFDGSLYFRTYDGSYFKLFKYDGTSITDQNLRINGSSPKYLTTFNSKLYFYGTIDNDSGVELIEFDGTSASVVDIYEGTSSSQITPQTKNLKFATTSTHLYFEATDGINSYDLYSYDGTTLTRIPTNTDNSDLSGNSFIAYLGVANDKLYFQGYGGASTGVELWEHDGTNISEIVIRSGEESSSVRHMAELNGELYFTANYGDGTKDWLVWKYDGTSASFISYNGLTEPGDPYYFVTAGDKVYFSANDGIHGYELWSTDGTTTELVADQYQGIDDTYNSVMRGIGDKVFYFGSTDSDDLMYVYDGVNFETFNLYGDEDGAFIEYNGAVYFQGWTSEFGGELYKYDNSEVTLVQDIREGSSSSYPQNFFIWNSELYFSAGDGVNGTELWKYDGTDVSMVVDVNSEPSSSSPRDFVAVGTDLYFRASSSTTGTEIVKYDGTNVTFFDINDGTAHSYPSNLTEYNGKLVCVANDDTYLTELIIIDGTNIEVIDINTSGHSYPQDLFVYKDKLYLSAYTDTEGRELYVYDGTDLTMIDLMPGSESSLAESFFEFGPYMYFSAKSGSNPYGIHRYDAIGEIEYLGAVGASFEEDYGNTNFAILDNYAYFQGEDESLDSELYRIRRIEVGNDIVSFSLSQQTGDATIDAESHTVSIEVAFDTDLSNLNPAITISDYAEIDLTGAQDFTNPVVYNITSEYGELQEWTVTVTEASNSIPILENPFSDISDVAGFSSTLVSYTGAFTDADGHTLNISVESSDNDVVTAEVVANNQIEIIEVGIGTSTITVTASDGFGGSVSDEFTFTVTEAPLGLAETLNVQVYPNPTADFLNVGASKSVDVLLIDLNGRTLQTTNGKDIQIDLRAIESGMYLLKVSDGTSTETKRIIKAN